MVETKERSKQPWSFPWGYGESFFIAFGLVIIGFLLELITNSSGISLPSWPFNAIVLVAFGVYILVTQKLWNKHPFVSWLSSTQAAISFICSLTSLILILGFVPQNIPEGSVAEKLGLNNIVGNWAFILSSLALLIILGFTIVRRLLPFNVKNIAFLFNHFGLWIILAAGFMGASDSQTLMLQVEEGQITSRSYDANGREYSAPFSIQLNDFVMEEYDPKLVMVRLRGNNIIDDETELIIIEPGTKTMVHNYEIEFVKYFDAALNNKGVVEESDKVGSTSAVFLKVRNTKTAFVKEAWVSCGSYMSAAINMELDNNYFIGMNPPTAKEFSSDITIFEDGKEPYNKIIEVNKPLKIQIGRASCRERV